MALSVHEITFYNILVVVVVVAAAAAAVHTQLRKIQQSISQKPDKLLKGTREGSVVDEI